LYNVPCYTFLQRHNSTTWRRNFIWYLYVSAQGMLSALGGHSDWELCFIVVFVSPELCSAVREIGDHGEWGNDMCQIRVHISYREAKVNENLIWYLYESAEGTWLAVRDVMMTRNSYLILHVCGHVCDQL
jgi:hypothetical protein